MPVPPTVAENERRRSVARGARATVHDNATMLELKASLGREQELIRIRDELLTRQTLLAEEFEHRLINSLQVIVSLLSLQSRSAKTTESADQLMIAAQRIAALGRVHRRLHMADLQATVDLKRYVEDLCDDLAGLLFNNEPGRAIVVTGAEIKLPTGLGIPLGFIVNELITNAVKYAAGSISIAITTTGNTHALSVTDEGPGLTTQFDPTRSTGLGMKIIQSLVTQINGTLSFAPGEDGRGTCFTVTFTPKMPQ